MDDRCIIITDTHLHDGNIELHRSIWNQVREIGEREGAKRIIHAGDWLVSRKAQTELVLNELDDEINRCVSAGFEIHTIPGNHDKTDYKSESSFLRPFRNIEGFNVYDSQASIPFGRNNITFLPYFDESDMMPERIKTIMGQLLITHCNFIDFSGDNKKFIDPETIKGVRRIISGHVHNRYEKGKVLHHPSPYQANFGEDNEKGISILNLDFSLDFYKLEYPEYETVTNIKQLSKSKAAYKRVKAKMTDEELIRAKQKHPEVEFLNVKEDTISFVKTESVSDIKAKKNVEHLKDFCKEKEYDFKSLKKYFS